MEEFQKLLDVDAYRTNVRVAVQLLEKMTPDKSIENKAIDIIKKIANGGTPDALGFKYWLKDWQVKSEK